VNIARVMGFVSLRTNDGGRGSAPPPAVLRAAEAVGIEMTHVYGLTETYGPHSVCAWHTDWDDASLEKRALLKARQGVPYAVFGTDMRWWMKICTTSPLTRSE